MILTIIFVVLTSIGISAFLLPSGLTDWIPEGLCWAILIGGFIGALGTVTAVGTYVCERGSSGYEEHYDEWDTRYRGLAARIEIWKQGAEDPKLWDDVKEYNKELEDAQYWANNNWTNWFNENACNEFETFDDIPTLENIPVDNR
jgi:hypothetical protein